MKRIFYMYLLLSVLSQNAIGQTFSEWFKQKKTQRKYAAAHIAKLQIYLEAAKKGYDIATDGLNLISDFKHGEFSLHKEYFTHLGAVGTVVVKYDKVTDTKKLFEYLSASTSSILKVIGPATYLTSEYKIHATSFLQAIRDDLSNLEQSLIDVLTQGRLEMSDQDRIQRIDKIYGSASKIKRLVISLQNEIQIRFLAVQQIKQDSQNMTRLFK